MKNKKENPWERKKQRKLSLGLESACIILLFKVKKSSDRQYFGAAMRHKNATVSATSPVECLYTLLHGMGTGLLNRRSGMPSRSAMRPGCPPPPPSGSWVFYARSLIIIFKKCHYQASPNMWKLLSTTYIILRQSLVLYRLIYVYWRIYSFCPLLP